MMSSIQDDADIKDYISGNTLSIKKSISVCSSELGEQIKNLEIELTALKSKLLPPPPLKNDTSSACISGVMVYPNY